MKVDATGVTVLNISGDPIEVSSLWRDQLTLLVFLRHYGWVFCREQAAHLNQIVEPLKKAEIQVAAVGNGNTQMAQAFSDEFDLKFPLYTDPSRQAYKAFKLKRNFGINLKTMWKGLKAFASGHRQGATQGDPWQQGGVLLINPENEILWHHINADASDHATNEQILNSIKNLKNTPTPETVT